MIATHVNFHHREVKSSMPYFGVFTRMFVHFHPYATHDAVYDSLGDLNFRNHCFTTYMCTAMYGHLMYDLQSGFRQNFSTDSCLIHLSDYILNNQDKGEYTGMVVIDLQKA